MYYILNQSPRDSNKYFTVGSCLFKSGKLI